MSELPEEAQRLKRAAWRAASRRYYARKVARQQANPQHLLPFPHITVSQYPQSTSLVDQRRRKLISELPDESQTLQREAWRAASRRYYARKTGRHQTDPEQYVHLLQNMEQSEDTLGPNRGGSHTNSGEIMCSWEHAVLLMLIQRLFSLCCVWTFVFLSQASWTLHGPPVRTETLICLLKFVFHS